MPRTLALSQRCFRNDGGRPSGVCLQERMSNYCMLLCLRGKVVSDAEKVDLIYQVSLWKMTEREPLLTCRECTN